MSSRGKQLFSFLLLQTYNKKLPSFLFCRNYNSLFQLTWETWYIIQVSKVLFIYILNLVLQASCRYLAHKLPSGSIRLATWPQAQNLSHTTSITWPWAHNVSHTTSSHDLGHITSITWPRSHLAKPYFFLNDNWFIFIGHYPISIRISKILIG